jgi:hypothetical protein
MSAAQPTAPELLEDVEITGRAGMTRSGFMLKGALATAAVYGVDRVAPFVGDAFAASGGRDADILNFALLLEHLETGFYRDAQRKGKLSGQAKQVAVLFGQQESMHVTTLKKTIQNLGAKPMAPPKFKFPITGKVSFLKLAEALEDTGVGAYNGAGPKLSSPDLLGAAGSIVQVEARHAATIRLLAGDPPAPNAFDKGLGMSAVKHKVKPFLGT